MAIIVDPFSGTPQEGKGLLIELDYDGQTDSQPAYVGYAEPGSGTDEPVWKIMHCIYDGSRQLIRREWALTDGTRADFKNIYDNRTTLTYG